MSSSKNASGTARRRQAPPGTRVQRIARTVDPLDTNALYVRLLAYMQEGLWPQAEEALAKLKGSYPDSSELRNLEQALALRLSAERTWAEATDRPSETLLRLPLVRGLLAANAVAYLLLGLLWLIATSIHSVH